MNSLIQRLLDRLFPSRVTIRILSAEIEMLTRELVTARKQFHETREVNHHNAASHRAAELAHHRALHVIEALQQGRKPEPVPAMFVPPRIQVPDPKAIPENSNAHKP